MTSDPANPRTTRRTTFAVVAVVMALLSTFAAGLAHPQQARADGGGGAITLTAADPATAGWAHSTLTAHADGPVGGDEMMILTDPTGQSLYGSAPAGDTDYVFSRNVSYGDFQVRLATTYSVAALVGAPQSNSVHVAQTVAFVVARASEPDARNGVTINAYSNVDPHGSGEAMLIYNATDQLQNPDDYPVAECDSGHTCGYYCLNCGTTSRFVVVMAQPGNRGWSPFEVKSTTQTFSAGQVSSPTVAGASSESSSKSDPSDGEPVDSRTGDFYVEPQTDTDVRQRGPDVDVDRAYTTARAYAGVEGSFGAGWWSWWDARIAADPTDPATGAGTVLVSQEDGSVTQWNPDGQGGWTGDPGVRATLTGSSTTGWVYTVREPGAGGVLETRVLHMGTDGLLDSVGDLDGNTATVTRTPGRTVLTGAGGRSVTLALDARGYVTTATDPLDRVTTYAYNTDDLLSTVTDPDDRVTTYAHDGYDNRVSGITSPAGVTVTNSIDANGRMYQQTDGRGKVTGWAYSHDQSGDAFTAITSPTGVVTRYGFDPAGYQTDEWQDWGGPQQTHTQDTWDDTTGAHLTHVDAKGVTTTFESNSDDQVTSTTDGRGHTGTQTYTPAGLPHVTTSPTGATETRTWTTGGDPATDAVTGQDGTQHTVVYHHTDPDHPDDTTSVTALDGSVAVLAHDAAGDLTSETDADGGKTSWGQDADGEPTSKVDPVGNAAGASAATVAAHTQGTAYDGEGTPTSTTDSDGTSSTVRSGATTTTTSPGGLVSSTTVDANGSQSTAALGTGTSAETTTLGYDDAEDVTSRTDPAGNAETFAYDRLHERTGTTDADGHTGTAAFDPDGLPSTVTDPDSRAVTVGYDEDGDPVRVTGTGIPTETATYDDADHPTGDTVDGVGGTAVSYGQDGLPRQIVHTGPTGTTTHTQTLGRNASGLVTDEAVDGAHTTSTYDHEGRKTSVTDPWGGTFTATRDPDGVTTSLAYSDGTTDHTTLDPQERPTAVTVVAPDGTTVLGSYAATRDADGQTVGANTNTGAAQTYGHDEQGRITDAAGDIGFDRAGNVTTLGATTVTADAAGHTTSSTTGGAKTDYATDLSGDRTTTTPDGAASPSATLAWDAAHHLTGDTATDPTTGTTTGAVGYAYGPGGLVASRTQTDATGATTGAQAMLWDPTTTVPELLDDGTFTYVYGPDGQPVEQRDDITGVRTFLHGDATGSTRLLTRAGAAVGTYDYAPYGAVTGHTGETTRIGFAGQWTDPTTGLVYMRARWYDPTTASFLSVDPLLPMTVQPGQYADGDPLDVADPLGLWGLPSWSDVAGAAHALGAVAAVAGVAAAVTVIAVALAPVELPVLAAAATLTATTAAYTSIAAGTAETLTVCSGVTGTRDGCGRDIVFTSLAAASAGTASYLDQGSEGAANLIASRQSGASFGQRAITNVLAGTAAGKAPFKALGAGFDGFNAAATNPCGL